MTNYLTVVTWMDDFGGAAGLVRRGELAELYSPPARIPVVVGGATNNGCAKGVISFSSRG